MDERVAGRELRDLKARAQRLKPMARIGREGLSAGFLESLDDALARHELVKVKFEEFKDQKKELAPVLADKMGAQVIMRVGNVVVLYRKAIRPGDEAALNPG